MRIAIIGAGMAGLSAARELSGHDVVLFDKSRGVGGRMSTRYAGDYEFDHGAQYFTVTDPDFRALVEGTDDAAPWNSRGLYLRKGALDADTGRPRWVGAPRMNSLPKAMADGLDVRLGSRVSSIEKAEGSVRLAFEDGAAPDVFDHVICTVPAPQASVLLPDSSSLQSTLSGVAMHACFALMIGMPADATDFAPAWDSLRVGDLPVSWMAVNSRKPGRSGDVVTLVVHASPEWSDAHADDDRAEVQATLLECASALCGVRLDKAPHIALHRWLYAYADEGVGEDHLEDPDTGALLAGDWCVGGRVEGAWASGRSAARALLGKIGD